MLSRLSIKLRISLAMALGTLVLTVSLLAIGHYLYLQKEAELHSTFLSGLDNLWNAITDSEQSAMAANFTSLTRNRALTTALYQENTDNIKDASSPTATRMKAMELIDNMMVFDKNGILKYSMIEEAKTPPIMAK
jgi:hypothetical protein